MAENTFDNLLLIARPGAGKSEIIAHLKQTPLEERRERYHIGRFIELDDFPLLWAWFEEDDILQRMGHPRLHSTPDHYFLKPYFWDVLIERLSLAHAKLLRDQPDITQTGTVILEFSRGKQHGGFRQAFQHLSREIADHLAILYINVSWEESLRKNQARYNPKRPDSILEHGLSDEKMEFLYRDSDWEELTALREEDLIPIQGVEVPYGVLENEDDLTTRGGEALAERLSLVLDALYQKYRQFQNA